MTSFNLFISNFHFVRPYWLLALFALFLVLWLLKKHRFYQSPWQQFLPSHLSQVLVEGNTNTNNNKKTFSEQTFLIKPFIIGLLCIIALAGPVWKKLPQPVYQTERGSVLIRDMSYSMYATDVKPNRLTRARFKAIDLLNKINEGDTGLIAYAGDAFIISPLTQDIKNIALLLPSLTPEIMPTPGANPIAALTLAHNMLINAGHLNGDIYWFTDDVDNDEISDIYEWSNTFGHQLNILGIGSENGAPITLPSGELLKDNDGAIVVPRLPAQKLQSLASRGKGHYQTIKNDDSDINDLILKDNIPEQNRNEEQKSQQTGDQWQEQGAWLLILVLPLILSYFRRGSTLLILPISCIPLLLLSFSIVSTSSFAADVPATKMEEVELKNSQSSETTLVGSSKKLWRDLWQTNDQQAQKKFNQENYQDAAQQFDNAQWQGSAHYKAGNYEAALNAFKKGENANSANSLYNQGNALAQMQQYEEAIKSYEEALNKNPDLQDAKDNIEKIKQQQKEQEQEQEQQDKQSESDDSQDEQSKDQEKSEDQQKSDSEQNQDKQNENDQQQSDDAKNADDNKESSEKGEQEQQEKDNKEQEAKQEQETQEESAEKTDKQEQKDEKKTAAQIAAEQQEKETDQKHQQLLNKVTDDPYLLLRNKMQIEYQKRKQDGTTRGVNKQW